MKTIADFEKELAGLRRQVAAMPKPPASPEAAGQSFLKKASTSNESRFDSLVRGEDKKRNDAGLRKAADLLGNPDGHYEPNANGTRKLSRDAGISLEQARELLSSHLALENDAREMRDTQRREANLGRARGLASGYLKHAARHGIDHAAGKLADKLNISPEIARQAIDELTQEDEAHIVNLEQGKQPPTLGAGRVPAWVKQAQDVLANVRSTAQERAIAAKLLRSYISSNGDQ